MCLVCRGRIHATHPGFFRPLQGPHICGPYTPFGKAVSHCRHSDIAGALRREWQMRLWNNLKIRFLAAALLWAALSPMPEGAAPARAAGKPERLIAMTLATAEMLLALAPRERIVGLHKLAGHPGYSNVADKVGNIPLIASAPERIIALRPDMVFVASYSSAAFLNHLRAAKVPVSKFSAFSGVEDVFASIEKMGRLIGEEAKAEKLIKDAREKIRAIRARIPKNRKPPRILTMVKGGWVTGADTSHDVLIRLAGGENVAAERGIRGARRVSAERIIAWNPDVIMVGANPESGAGMKDLIRANGVYAPLRAKKIVEIPYPRFSSVSQYIAGALDDLVRGLYR